MIMSEGNAVPGSPTVTKRNYPADGREKALLGLSLGLGILMGDLLLTLWRGSAGLELAVTVLAWEGLLLWYARRGTGWKDALRGGPSLWLTVSVLLLSLDFMVFSNRWFRLFNFFALAGLLIIQMFQLFGPTRQPWTSPAMLGERAVLLLEGLGGQLGAPIHTVSSLKKRPGRRGLYVLLGFCCVLPVMLLVVPLLVSADAVFSRMTERAVRFLIQRFGTFLGRVALGLCLAPFLFSLLYFLRRGDKSTLLLETAKAPPSLAVDPALTVTVLLPLDLLYLLFVAVQSAALFGGPAYLEAAGISYANYARSGFFQLVWVSLINLAVVVAAVHFCRREGILWQAAKVLATVMAALSALMLCSAAWRMTLYVGVYGLSFKRVLTYWGMVMLAVFFTAALLKIWKKDFGFFQVFFAASVAGWLLLNAVNVDGMVARYNVSAYLTGNSTVLDLPYLAGLSYDALPALEKLPGDMPARGDATLEEVIADRRNAAAREAGDWRTWSLSAWLAAG